MIVEALEFPVHGRVDELVKTEIEAALLIGHEGCCRVESRTFRGVENSGTQRSRQSDAVQREYTVLPIDVQQAA